MRKIEQESTGGLLESGGGLGGLKNYLLFSNTI